MYLPLLATLTAWTVCANAFNPLKDEISYQNSGNKGHFTMKSPGVGVTSPQQYSSVATFQEGDLINITWTTVLPFFDLVILQPTTEGGANINVLTTNISSKDPASLSYPYSATLSNSSFSDDEGTQMGPMFYFMVRNSSNRNDFFTSSFFNVTKASSNKGSSTTTTTASGTKPTGTGSGLAPPSSATTTSSATTSSSASSAGYASQSGISGGAIAGIVVGVVVGLAVIGALLWRFCWVPRKKQAYMAATVNPPPVWSDKGQPPAWAPAPVKQGPLYTGVPTGPAELPPGQNQIHEVDATPPHHGPQELP